MVRGRLLQRKFVREHGNHIHALVRLVEDLLLDQLLYHIFQRDDANRGILAIHHEREPRRALAESVEEVQ
jgi:hypothetical protein